MLDNNGKDLRGHKIIFNSDLLAELDRTKVLDRKPVFVLSETVKSLDLSTDE